MLILPLGFWAAYIFNWTSHLAYRQSEQIRVDAVTLSLCHQRKNFLKSKVLRFNSQIKIFQVTMDAAATACLSSGYAAPIVCPNSLNIIRATGASAKALQTLQDTRRLLYPMEAKKSFEELKSKNELEGRFDFNLLPTIYAPMIDGLKREILTPIQLGYQTLFGTTWPQPLEKSGDFSSSNKTEIRFYPERTMAREGIKKTEKRTVRRGLAMSVSGCAVNQSLEVERRL